MSENKICLLYVVDHKICSQKYKELKGKVTIWKNDTMEVINERLHSLLDGYNIEAIYFIDRYEYSLMSGYHIASPYKDYPYLLHFKQNWDRINSIIRELMSKEEMNPLLDRRILEEVNISMDLANQLYYEAKELPKNRDLRLKKLYAKYEPLYFMSPTLFETALSGELYEGDDVSKIVRAFQSGGNDPTKIAQNFEDYLDEQTKKLEAAQGQFRELCKISEQK